MHREELIERIRQAFPDEPWPEHQGPSSWDFDREYFEEHYCGRRWHELTQEELRYLAMDAWVFEEEELAYFLPGFMTTDLKNKDWTLNSANAHVRSASGYLMEHWTREQLSLLLDTILFLYQNDEEFEHLVGSLKGFLRG